MLNNFAAWVDKNLDLTVKSKRDIISRLKRVSTLINVDKVQDEEEARYLLSQNKEFALISKTIQSQLKRSINLYLQFKRTL